MAAPVEQKLRIAAGLVVSAALLVGCSSDSLPQGRAESTATSTSGGGSSDDIVESTTSADPTAAGASATESSPPTTAPQESGAISAVVAPDTARRIDRRLFGTNLPAWLGPETLGDQAFRDTALDSGITVVRMPGGSWSNSYDWLACENGSEGCFWTWAARPSDFVDFLDDTGLEGMWTVSINDTAESAAAAVAFFNGSVDDERPIGVDRNGADWATVGTWARLRADGGHPEPVRIELWEVGNEVYGGRPDAGGEECASFGWEEVWTCDGAAYVDGDAAHDGYLTTRAAMTKVDPTISVGAVGVGEPSSWSNWGNEVIDGAAGNLDFYVVHHYGFDQSPDADEALGRPAEVWPGLIESLSGSLQAEVPIAITEYNLVSFASGDIDRTMTRATNALYIAETIGQMAVNGVSIANQWNLANGTAEGGTDYGMIDLRDGSVFPQYHAMRLWGMAGDTLLDHEQSDAAQGLRLYPTRRDDGSLAIVMLNLGAGVLTIDLDLGVVGSTGTLTTVRADDLSADDLVEEADRPVAVTDAGMAELELAAWSMNVLEVASDG